MRHAQVLSWDGDVSFTQIHPSRDDASYAVLLPRSHLRLPATSTHLPWLQPQSPCVACDGAAPSLRNPLATQTGSVCACSVLPLLRLLACSPALSAASRIFSSSHSFRTTSSSVMNPSRVRTDVCSAGAAGGRIGRGLVSVERRMA